jgi:hypothetical protein
MEFPSYETAEYYYYEFDGDDFSTLGEHFPFVIENHKIGDSYHGTIWLMKLSDENVPVSKGLLGKFYDNTLAAQYEGNILRHLHTLKSPRIVRCLGRFGDDIGTRGITLGKYSVTPDV